MGGLIVLMQFGGVPRTVYGTPKLQQKELTRQNHIISTFNAKLLTTYMAWEISNQKERDGLAILTYSVLKNGRNILIKSNVVLTGE